MFLPHRVISIVAALGILRGAPLLAQQRVTLPPPDSSRAPLLTKLSSDSIRYQTAYQHAAELLQALQAGDATMLARMLADATLGLSTCSVGQALAKLTSVRGIVGSDGRTSRAVFFDKIAIVDSGATQVVTADLVLVLTTPTTPTRSSVRLVLDPERAVWTREAGLLNALCDL